MNKMLPLVFALLVVSAGSNSTNCNAPTISVFELYKQLLFHLSGDFFSYSMWYQNNELANFHSDVFSLSVYPVNTTFFNDRESFYVVTNCSLTNTTEKFLMTLKIVRSRHVEIQRYYFLPNVTAPGNVISSQSASFFRTLTKSSLDPTRTNCGGSIFLVFAPNTGSVGTLNICEVNRQNPPVYHLDFNCQHLLFYEGYGEGNGSSHILWVRNRRRQFPFGWTVVGQCERYRG